MDPRQSPIARRGVRRRTVLTTAAWSAPVIAAAVATPLASASDAADVEFVALTGYDYTTTFFNTALDTRYDLDPGLGFEIHDNGATAIPAGSITATVSVDADTYRVEDGDTAFLSVQTDEGSTSFEAVATVAGGVATAVLTVPVEIAADTTSNVVYVNLPFYNSALEDVYDQYPPPPS